jgi:SPP1 family predicted phage head-tail adaptor
MDAGQRGMDAGQLRTLFQLQSVPTAQDSAGQPTGAWPLVASVWGNVRNLSGMEAIRGGAEASLALSSVRIRYRADVAAGMRLVDGAVTYHIQAVLPDQRRRYADLVCQVVT